MKNTKRGFTIVELVIVIAVIAILAAILIPVFADVTDKANATSQKANIKNAHSAHVAAMADAGESYGEIDDYIYVSDGKAYSVDDKGNVSPNAATTNLEKKGTYGAWELWGAKAA